MRYIFITAFLMVGFGSKAQGINFEHDTTLAQLIEKSKKFNKPIFIDCYTSWCGPCKWMVKNVFPTDTAGNYFNEHFVCAKFDMEKGDGKNIANRYAVHSFPTYLFLDSAGITLHRFIGAQPTKLFIQNAEATFDIKTRYGSLKDKYKKGDRDIDFLQKFILASYAAGDNNVPDLYYWYIALLPDSKFVSKENFAIISLFARDYPSAATNKFMERRKEFEAMVEKEKIDKTAISILSGSLLNCFIDDPVNPQGPWLLNDEPKFLSLMKEIRSLGINDTIGAYSYYVPKYYLAKGNHTAYINTLRKSLPLCCWNDAIELNEKAWDICQTSNDKNDLLLALSWSKRSIELNDNYYFNDTYAALCYKLKNKKDALKYQQKAIELGQKNGDNISGGKARMELIKKMK